MLQRVVDYDGLLDKTPVKDQERDEEHMIREFGIRDGLWRTLRC
jgi:hypothetical protein